ncbi:MAG: hypothetical protein JSV78_12090 [Phycisphaerales bacterium]|nr:MAG: hypothetical protein JSV78_12090 [Phycisphaerales bacterium]
MRMKVMRPQTTNCGVPAVTAALVLLLGGCNQSLRVKVELIDFPPTPEAQASWDQESQKIHEIVKESIARRASDTKESLLFRLAVTTVWTEQAADLIRETCCEHLASFQPDVVCDDDELQAGYERFYDDMQVLSDLRERAQGLLQEYPDLEPAVFMAEAKCLLIQAELVADQIAYLTSSDPTKAIEAFEKHRADTRDITLMERMAQSTVQPSIAFTVRRSSNLVFGGFLHPTIYEINPGSEAYRFITRCKPVGDAFSRVDIDAAGKSTAMIVQESPGQFRLREVSNDPSILLQNAVFITDMTLRAAAQYAGLP